MVIPDLVNKHIFMSSGQVLVEDTKLLIVQGSENKTSPGGHIYPSRLDFNWQNGSDTVRLTLSDPKIIAAGSSTMKRKGKRTRITTI